MAIKQEETQWWISNIINLWKVVADVGIDTTSVIGCYSGEKLPLIEHISAPEELLDLLIKSIEWHQIMADDVRFNNGILAVESLITQLKQLNLPSEKNDHRSIDFIDIVKLITSNESKSSSRINCENIVIATPKDAFGQSADVVIIAGLDSESWSMKPNNVPWLDNSTKVKLGLANPDIKIRQGRHELRHIINANQSIIVIDTSLDEAASPSPPLAEWLEEVNVDESIFSEVPDIVSERNYDNNNPLKAWDLLETGTKKGFET